MRIVHVPRRFTRHSWGGTETVVSALARAQRSAGHDPVIHTSRALDSTPFEIMDGVEIHRHAHSYPWLRLHPDTRDQMDRVGGNLVSWPLGMALRGESAELMHLHTGKRLGGIVRTVARSRDVPYVVTLHGGLAGRTRAAVAEGTEVPKPRLEWGRALGVLLGSRRVHADAGAVVHLDPADGPILSDAGVRNVVHIPNGVDSARFADGDGGRFRDRFGIPRDATVLAIIGRIDRQKNQLETLHRFARWRAAHPQLRLLLVGPVTDPGLHARIVEDARALGVADALHLVDGLAPGGTDLVDAYHAADVMLVPSRHEPFGIVVLEAWAAGRPVIASRVGGIPTFVESESDALLVDPDDESGWDSAVDLALREPGRRAVWADRGRLRARAEFDWSSIARRYDDLYSAVLREHRS